MTEQTWLYISLVASLISIGVASYLYYWVKKQDPGTARAQEVASWIREGAKAYLKRLYLALTIVAVILGFIIAVVFSFDLSEVAQEKVSFSPTSGLIMAAAFVGGALCSAVAGIHGAWGLLLKPMCAQQPLPMSRSIRRLDCPSMLVL